MLVGMNRTPYSRWTAGSVLSWALGVTLGVILGVALLIATPIMMRAATPAPSANAEAGETAQAGSNAEAEANSASGTAGEAGTDMASGSSGAAGTNAESGAGGESGSMAGSASTGTAAGEGATPPAAPATEGAAPAAGASGDVQAGQTVYAANCSGCHGENGQGVVGPSLVTADGPKAWTDAQFLATLREGKTPERQLSAAMPRFSEAQISDAQVVNLHAYIKTLN